MDKKFFLTSFFFLLSISCSTAQNDNSIAERFVRTALTDNVGYKWLAELCEIGPRLSGSENSLRAIKWAENKMKECKFDSVWLQPVMVPHWERGKYETAAISRSNKFNKHELTITALGGSIGTGSEGITSEIIEVKKLDEVDKLGENARGKIIFYNRPFDAGLVNTFDGYGGAVDQRSEGAIHAAKVGAVAVLVRSVQSGYDDIPHTGVMRYENDLKKIPAAAISVVDADYLSKALKAEPNLNVTIKLDCKILPEAKSFNVIGELRGKEIPKEVIVVGGHFDSWDKGCGAHDDGAPSVQSIEAIELFKRLDIKPKRTIRCILFINEENGLRGGIEYGKYSETALENHIAAIESDRGAFTPRGFNVTTDSLTFQKLLTWLPILNKSKIDWIRKGGSGADIGQIKNCKALFGFVPDDQRYMDLHHSANDTFSSVHPREMELGTSALATMIYLISEYGL